MITTTPETPSSALYRAVWRWHFFAGIFVAPFAIFLAITGSIYLWKPQYEAWKYKALFNVEARGLPLSAEQQFAAARAAHPNWGAVQYLPPRNATRSAEIQLQPPGDRRSVSVYVDPYSGRVLGEISDDTRLMRIVHDLHGTLLAGRTGELLVELAASWAFVLLVTGFYLWWPRPFSIRGFLLPRFGEGRRALLRDLHAVPAVWLSLIILCILATGIQWTPIGGQWARILAQTIGEWQPRETNASAHRSELLGGWSPYMRDKATAEKLANVASEDPHAGHHHGGSSVPLDQTVDPAHPRISLDKVVAIAAERGVEPGYAIAFPRGERGVYSIFSDRNRAFSRAYIHLDQYSGKVLADVRFKDFGRMAQFYSFGIIAHEGQLFGLTNQILGSVACIGVILLAVTGVMLWWIRRPKGALAAPVSSVRLFGVSRGAVAIAVILAAMLPLMAATLAMLLVGDFIWRKVQAMA
ncbi:MAG TPA: PepSY domain-containing protein [Opitutaceae bacterium]|nr:PepSY domain-containing protein [Opitutaceae bacterium]